MKKFVILSLFLVTLQCSWAQHPGMPMKMPVADKSKEIPMKPIVVEGELSGVPDGTRVSLAFRIKKTKAFYNANNTLVDTIRNGKFHIEKKFVYKDFDENDDNVEYMVNIEWKGMPVYAYPGAKVKVTGTPALNAISWRAESNHPLQKEFFEYADYEHEKLSAIRKRIQEEYEADEVDDDMVEKLERAKDSIQVVSMLDFMKNKEYNSVFAMNLNSISFLAKQLGNSQLKDRLRNLIMEKVPADCDNQDIDLAKAFLSMDEPQRTVEETKELKFGDKMRDFTLYDRKGNEHKLSEFKGKYIILEFTSKNCGPCLEAIPVLDWLYKRYKDKIEVVAISVDNSWMEGNNNKSFHEWTAQQYASDMSIAYGIKGTPNFVIIHPNGNLLNVSAGLSRFLKEFNDYVQELPREEIKKMLAKK